MTAPSDLAALRQEYMTALQAVRKDWAAVMALLQEQEAREKRHMACGRCGTSDQETAVFNVMQEARMRLCLACLDACEVSVKNSPEYLYREEVLYRLAIHKSDSSYGLEQLRKLLAMLCQARKDVRELVLVFVEDRPVV